MERISLFVGEVKLRHTTILTEINPPTCEYITQCVYVLTKTPVAYRVPTDIENLEQFGNLKIMMVSKFQVKILNIISINDNEIIIIIKVIKNTRIH